MGQVAKVLGVENGFVRVESIRDQREVESEGRLFRWRVNSYTFLLDKEYTMERLGISSNEYNKIAIELGGD